MHSERITVDGQKFTVVRNPAGSVDYLWESGPNAGYGFTSGCNTAFAPTEEDHRRLIKEFLAMIDPKTGFIAD